MGKGPGSIDDPFNRPHFVRRGRHLAQMLDYPKQVPDLPWPKDLYTKGDVTIAMLMADTPYFVQGPKSLNAGEKCDFTGCNAPHGYKYKWQRRGDYGIGWRISYFCSDSHKTLAIKEASK